MFTTVFEKNTELNDIIPYYTGYHRCSPAHTYGPHIRAHYLIHFVLSGKGILQNENGVFKIKSGEMFIIKPDEVTTYTADTGDPWEYVWIAFGGSFAKLFSSAETVYKTDSDYIARLTEQINTRSTAPEIYAAFIFELSHKLLCNEKTSADDEISRIKRYIRLNYMDDIKVGDLAKEYGFERSYLFRKFKERQGIGIKDYIIKKRMEKAKEFLELGHSVSDTAYLVGYKDEFNFSKAFKKFYGSSPIKIKNAALKNS